VSVSLSMSCRRPGGLVDRLLNPRTARVRPLFDRTKLDGEKQIEPDRAVEGDQSSSTQFADVAERERRSTGNCFKTARAGPPSFARLFPRGKATTRAVFFHLVDQEIRIPYRYTMEYGLANRSEIVHTASRGTVEGCGWQAVSLGMSMNNQLRAARSWCCNRIRLRRAWSMLRWTQLPWLP
jgi:hypothetical protein